MMGRYFFLALCGLVLTGGFASARDSVPATLTFPPAPALQEPVSPYPLSYADEVARRLGVVHGHMDVFEASPSRDDGLVPSLKGGVDRNGAGLKLQWKIGK
jgi:hypothetical protein